MSDESQRRPWTEGPDEDAPPESWLRLDDDALLHRIETKGAEEDADDRLLEVVEGDRHFFVRQEAAKRVRTAAGCSRSRTIGTSARSSSAT